MRIFHRVTLVCVFLCTLGSSGAADSRFITASDLFQIRQLGTPAISPDGKWVVYTVKDVVEKPGTPGEYVYRSQLWLASADGRIAPRALTHGEQLAATPQWSPDGRTLAFTRGETGKAQLWLLPLAEGGEPFALTKLENNVANPRWSPDGQRIAFMLNLTTSEVRGALTGVADSLELPWNDERPNRKPTDTPDWFDKTRRKDARSPSLAQADGTLAERRDWLARNEADGNPRVVTRLNFLGEGDLEPQIKFSNLFVIEAREGAAPRAIAPNFENVGGVPGRIDGGSAPAWSPDSRWIYVTGRLAANQQPHPDRLRENDLIRISADGKTREVLNALPGYTKSSPAVSPDGHSVAFLASDAAKEGYAQTQIGIWTDQGAAAQSGRLVDTQLDRSATQVRWSADGRTLWYLAASEGDFPLFTVPVEGGKAQIFTPPETGVTGFDVRGDRVAFVQNSVANPSELVIASVDRAGAATTLTRHNRAWLEGRTLATMERRRIRRPDGLAIDTWLMRPPQAEPGRRYPLLVQIHGGPSAMWGPGEPSMWHEFQFFAARGFAIVFCNPRGSGGYGYAFQHGNYQNWGPGPGADVLAAADLAAREPWVDASRAVITGGSYGGYLTAWILTQDTRFKAAVAQRGVYDLITFFGEGNAWRLVPNHFGGYPWEPEIRKVLDANSPFLRVAAIKTPLLIQHGDADLRTGVRQSEMLYKALKVLERPVEYVRYPRATHELSRSGEPRQRVDTLVRYEEFFRRFIGEANAPGSDTGS